MVSIKLTDCGGLMQVEDLLTETFDSTDFNATQAQNEGSTDAFLRDEVIVQDTLNDKATSNTLSNKKSVEGPSCLTYDENVSRNEESSTQSFKRKRTLTVSIPGDDRFKLYLPSKVNWKEIRPKLREIQPYQVKSEALDLIHQAYTDLIDMKDTVHIFTMSQFLQFLSVYRSFVKLSFKTQTKVHLSCPIRFKCKSNMSLKLDTEKELFYLS
ncbi:unnamed protein product [Ambrosiozyma monospora]|uniref:Unnamed protein product n=1 Tax=Ambrosiozyma monospora TaxID=43982 RepID=A0ACB5TAN9_AMBMO|nr:unnamed protein product [Ambrosiozyma monospora]